MEWKPLEFALKNNLLPEGYCFIELKKEEITRITQLLGEWYPDIQVGSESRHLKPEFYHSSVYFSEDRVDRPCFALTIQYQGEIVGFINLQKDVDARNISSPLGCIAPHHRGHGLAHIGPLIIEAMGRAINAELVYYFVTLKTPHQQVAAEKAGFQLVGIIPAYDRDRLGPGIVRRVYEAIYAKILIDESQVLIPHPEALTSNTKRLFDVLFGTQST